MKQLGPTFLEVDDKPEFVILRHDEYLRLIALASNASKTSYSSDDHVPQEVSAENEDELVASVKGLDQLGLLPREVRIPADGSIPHEVVEAMVHNHWHLIRAWREYLGVTYVELSERLGISVRAYEEIESSARPLLPQTRERLAAALGLMPSQLVSRLRRVRHARPSYLK